MEQLESEKHELDSQVQEFRNSNPSATASSAAKGQDRISQLEQELSQTRDQLVQSQREVQKLQSQIRVGGKDVSTTGPVLSKSRSLEVNSMIYTFRLNVKTSQSDRERVLVYPSPMKMSLNYNETFKTPLKGKQIFANNSNSQKKR